jgi:hypothetical protein
MAEQEKPCAHSSCKCVVAEGSTYCSEYCRDARDVIEIGCGCEHEPCVDKL